MLASFSRLDNVCRECSKADELESIDECDGSLSECESETGQNIDNVFDSLFGVY